MQEKLTLIEKIDLLNDLADGVLAVPMPRHLNREEVILETDLALQRLLNNQKQ